MNPDSSPMLLHLTPRLDLGILVGRWGFQPDPALLPAAYEALTAEALATGCRFWLQDIRRRTLNDPQTTTWLLQTYFPDMAARLGGRLYVAYLVGPTLHQLIVSQPDFILPAGYENTPHVVAFFGDEGAAMHWLQAQQ